MSRVAPARQRAGVAPRVALLLAWFALPLVPLLLWAAADRWSYPAALPTDWGVTGWRQALDQGALPALGRSVLLGLAVAALATPAGAMAGRALALHRVPARRVVEALLLAPVAVPPFAVVMGLTTLALRLGVPAGVGLVVVLAVSAVPYTVFVMRAAYAGHDIGMEEEARTLGAGPRAVLLRVHLPLLAPALATAAFLAFLVGWSDYVVTLVVGGGRLVTLPMLVGALSSATGNDAVVAAVSLAAVLPPLALLLATALLARRGAR
ncbi:putative spermidine/putrescine transport system permease protein [Geodermatophilus bullaregiensis]|uniref:ABC transporter permease n=1 Tax=Geodermatophilus bullaregiensis TaxID=1564160 RepID=UPI0027DB85B7|nr:ABC transporter permease subunit [Geodermatophilus bullaregiensis]MBM7808844.1 putative spermidine/putrescine transport system permease protein [Geodermatophilus bullaregiensis]